MPAASDTASAERSADAHHRSRRQWITAAAVLVVIVLAWGAWSATAWKLYSDSFDRRASLQQRTDSAELAARLDGSNVQYAARASVMAQWLLGSQLLSEGKDLPAMLTLGEAYRLDVGDPELLALFQKAQHELETSTNFKAHLQHAHEGPNGELRPQDVVP